MVEDDFEAFARAAASRLYSFGLVITGNPEDASDLLQATLEKLMKIWGKSDLENPYAYARTAMSRLHVSQLRRVRLSRQWRQRETGEVEAQRSGNAGGDLAQRVSDKHVIAAAMRSLPVRQRQAVALRYFEDLSVEETAAIMRCSSGTVKKCTHLGLQKLRSALDEHFNLEDTMEVSR